MPPASVTQKVGGDWQVLSRGQDLQDLSGWGEGEVERLHLHAVG